MAQKPKRKCGWQGCANTTRGRYCAEHEAKATELEHKQDIRPREYWARYGTTWRRVSAAYLAANPLCERCADEGRTTPAVHVHHKKPLEDGGDSRWENLQSLCHTCHNKTHANLRCRPRGAG